MGLTQADLLRLARRPGRVEFAAPREALLLMGGEATDPTEAPSRIQVFYEGQWKEHPKGAFQLTRQTFEELIANRQDDEPIDREHESVLSLFDADGAQGYVRGLEIARDQQGREALFARVEWTEDGLKNILPPRAGVAARFRYVSGGVHLKARDRATGAPIGAFLDHVAITKKPFLQGMTPITASFFTPGPGRADGGAMLKQYLIRLLKAPADADESAVLASLQQLESEITQLRERGGKLGLVLAADALSALELSERSSAEEVSRAIVELSRRAGASTELADRVAKLELERITSELDGAIAAFKVEPAERDELLALGKESPDRLRRLLSKRTARPPHEGVTVRNKPAGETVYAKQSKAIDEYLAKHPRTSYPEAIVVLSRTNPELFADEDRAATEEA